MRSKINLLNRNNFGGVAMTLLISLLLVMLLFLQTLFSKWNRDLPKIDEFQISIEIRSLILEDIRFLRFSNIVSQTSSAMYYTHNSLNRYISKVCNFKVNEACWPIYWNVYMKYVEIPCMKNSKYLMAISKQFL